MQRFSELDASRFTGGTVIIDIDGTLTTHSGDRVGDAEKTVLAHIGRVATPYLFSNKPLKERNQELARVLNIPLLQSHHKKPDPRVLRELGESNGNRYVIGDKILTDGLLALFTGAEFIPVQRISENTEGVLDRILCAIDDAALRVWPVASRLYTYARAIRAHQFIKNGLVFAPLFFAGVLLDPAKILAGVWTFIAFSATAGGMYILNDTRDSALDREHPKKKHRPIASGAVSLREAWVLLAFLGTVGVIALFQVPAALPAILAYVVINSAYSFGLKQIAVVDILVVSTSYVLRVLAGGEAAATAVSPWIILCTFFGALTLISGKRLAEYAHATRRTVLEQYSEESLRMFLMAASTLAIITYAIWSIIAARPFMVYSSVFVVAALFRVVAIIMQKHKDAETPESMVFKDPVVLGAFLGWVVYAAVILYV